MLRYFALFTTVALAACSQGSSGEAPPGASGTGSAPTARATSTAAAAPAAPAGAVKQMTATLGKCSVTAESNVPLTPEKDNNDSRAMFMNGDGVIFTAYREDADRAKVGARTVEDLAKKAERKGKIKWLQKRTSDGIQLVVWDNDGGESRDENAVEGEGVATASTDTLRCSFTCSGPRTPLKDVQAMCESARITIK